MQPNPPLIVWVISDEMSTYVLVLLSKQDGGAKNNLPIRELRMRTQNSVKNK
jgi:hypothetical protein